MSLAAVPFPDVERGAPRALLPRAAATAALVAVLDYGYIWVVWVAIRGVSTGVRLFQSIATSLLGPAAFQRGLPAAALGALLHVAVACAWTGAWAVAVHRSARLRRVVARDRGAIGAGLAFGCLVWLAMDLVVLPLTRAKPTPTSSPMFLYNLVEHALLVGLPIAWLVRDGRER